MQTIKKFVSILLVFSLILPLLAQARAGGSYGGGSRSFGGSSSRGYQGGNYNYKPHSTYQAPNYQTPYATPRSGAAYSPRPQGSFLSGLFSGAIGAYLVNKIFNSNSQQTQNDKAITNPQNSPSQGFGFFRLLILGVAIYFIWRFIRNRRRNNDPRNPQHLNQPDRPPSSPKMNLKDFINMAPSLSNQAPEALSQDEYRSFEEILLNVQNAWSQYNLPALENVTTPQMYQNFANIIGENQQRNITNNISQVKLLKEERQEAWQENNAAFVRVAMTWSAIDYAFNSSLSSNDPGYVIDGDPNQPAITTEIWTFTKQNNGPWLLAEIQQV